MNKKSLRSIVIISIVTMLAGGFYGCSGKEIADGDPAVLMKDAESDIESDRLALAIEKLRLVRNKHPYSNLAIDAHLRIADVYFMQEEWAEAAAQYDSFRELHPKHEKVSYALFRTAKSYFNDSPTNVARDQSSAQRARNHYEEYVRRFPTGKEADDARHDLAEAKKRLSEKELYVANFYFKRDFFDSAKTRYEKLIEAYPESEAAVEAKEKLAWIAKNP